MFEFARQRAYLHLFTALALGCAAGHRWPVPVELLAADAVLLVFIFALLAALWWTWRGQSVCWAQWPGFAALAFIGMLSVSVALGLPLTAGLRSHAGTGNMTVTGRVVSIPKYQRGHLRFMLQAQQVETTGKPQDTSGRCYVYLRCDEPPELYYSDRIELYGGIKEIEPPLNRGQFDYRSYLLQRGTVLTAYATSPRCLRRLDDGRPVIWAGLARLRTWLTGSLAHGLPADMGELAVSVVYGDKIVDLPDATEERFRRAGLTHILVASGTQISLLVVLLAMFCLRLTDDFSWRGMLRNLSRFALTLGVVLAYAAITGFETSIIRALAMGVLVMLGRLAHRQVDGLTALAQSGLILLLLNPLSLLSPGFQLSFGATFGLIYVAGTGFPLIAHLTGWRRWAAQTLITTGGAQLFVAPILAVHFQQLSLWGLLSNMLAIPLAFALLIAGGITSVGLSFIPLLGDLLRLIVWALAWLLDRTALVFAALPGSNIAVPHPPWWWLLAFYAALFLAGEWIKLRTALEPRQLRAVRFALPAAAALLCTGVLIWCWVPAPEMSTLSLKYSEACIWRPYTGCNVLLLRTRGLDRLHNADTVSGALRYRGINRLHGIVLLDAAPPPDGGDATAELPELIPDYSAPLFYPGQAVPDDWDLDWLPANDGTASGARLAMGGREIWLLWELPPQDHRYPQQAGTVVLTADVYRRLDARQRQRLCALSSDIRVVGETGQADGGVWYSLEEISIRPSATGIRSSVAVAGIREQ